MAKDGRIEARFLGGTSLLLGGQVLSGSVVRRHPLALLALLATAPGCAMSRPKLIGLLWPDADESTGRNRLSSTLYPLRQALGADVLTAAGDTLRLDRGGLRCDVWRFRDALESQDIECAVRVYRGPFLDGLYLEGSDLFEERVERERRDLQRAWRLAVRALAEAAEQAGRHGEAAHRWRALTASDPLNSGLASNLVRALAAAGRRYEALKTAEQHVALLEKELATEPDAVFQELMKRLRQRPVQGEAIPEASIAVMFFDAPDDGDSNTLGEGIHSGLLNHLATVEGLTVIARTSVRRYRESNRSAREIGEELGVRWVLEGGIQARDGQFRLDARLVEARGNNHVWAYDYVGKLSAVNYFSVQREIADELFERLRHQVTPDERIRLTHIPTEDLEAYRRSTEARMHLDHRSPENMQRALKCFEEAVVLDPEYAIAWVGIADTLGLMHAYGYAGPEVLPRAEHAIRTALETDPFCAEAHAAHGRMLGQLKREVEARKALRQAIALKPGYGEAYNWLTIGYQVSGNIEAAFDCSRRAVALNPLSAEAVGNFASTLLYQGRLDEALREARRALQLEPGYGTATFFAALAHYESGRFEETLELLLGLDLPWVGAGVDTVRALAHAGLQDWPATRERLSVIRSTDYPFDQGLVLAALGQTESAFDRLGQAHFAGIEFATGYWPTVCVRYLFRPIWDTLRNDVRYATLVQRINASWGPA